MAVKVLISRENLNRRVLELGREISADYAGRSIHCVGVLKGAFVFMADLVRALARPVTLDFLTIQSYGDLTQSSGIVKFLTDLTIPIEGRHVLVIEDIVDTGLTLHYLLENLRTRNPASLKVCALLHKPESLKEPVAIDYIGFTIPNRFVVGYGLDNAQQERNLPYIGEVEGNGAAEK